MTQQANHLLHLHYSIRPYLFFVFFSTLCSYNFHWMLSPDNGSEKIRIKWTMSHKKLQYALITAGFAGSFLFAADFIGDWKWIGVAVALTFLYSAPKLPFGPFRLLSKIAIGKTLFLTFVWTYVTCVLPVILAGTDWTPKEFFFCLNRFFLVYIICILFDKRDREQDRKQGIRSMITHFSEKNVRRLFLGSMLLFLVTAAVLYPAGFSGWIILALLAPGIITASLYSVSENNYSDYLYYFVLDGLMMLSALFTSLFSF